MSRNFFVLIVLSVFLNIGCAKRSVKVSEIDHLFLSYDHAARNNIGTTFKGTINALLKTGDTAILHKGVESTSSLYVSLPDSNLAVYYSLPDYKKNLAPVELKYRDRDGDTMISNDNVLLNFKGHAEIWCRGKDGNIGETGKSGSSFENSLYTANGGIGQPGGVGSDGNNLEVYVWKSIDTLFFYVYNQTTLIENRFLIVGDKGMFFIDVSGGDGGQGGQGGAGAHGHDGTNTFGNTQKPTAGGNGGNGAYGGVGGKGGNVIVSIHPTAKGVDSRLIITNEGGHGGVGGFAGLGGKGGEAVSGQTRVANGRSGIKGVPGIDGIAGQTYFLNREFEISTYLH